MLSLVAVSALMIAPAAEDLAERRAQVVRELELTNELLESNNAVRSSFAAIAVVGGAAGTVVGLFATDPSNDAEQLSNLRTGVFIAGAIMVIAAGGWGWYSLERNRLLTRRSIAQSAVKKQLDEAFGSETAMAF